jgi:hypothetical protein
MFMNGRKELADQAAAERLQNPYSVNRWVVIQKEGEFKDVVGKITGINSNNTSDTYTVMLYGDRVSKEVKVNGVPFVKDDLRPVQEYNTLNLSVEDYPCYEWFGPEERQKLEAHIKEIEDYIYWNYDEKQPIIPEWYLYFLRTYVRRWGGGFIPVDYGLLPLYDGNHDSKAIQLKPQQHYLVVSIKIDGKIRSDGHDPFVEAVRFIQDFLPDNHRATMTHYEYEPGDATPGYKQSSKAYVEFVVTKPSLPHIVLNNVSVEVQDKARLKFDQAGQELWDKEDTGPW